VIGKDHKYYGFVDLLDLVQFTSEMFSTQITTQQDVNDLFDKEGFWKETTVRQLIRSPLSKGFVADTIKQGYSLSYAFEYMARTGTHRVLIVDDNQRVVNLITQSMFIQFFHNHVDQLGEVAQCKVTEILTRTPITLLLSLKESEPAINGFDILAKQRVSGLAVVDEKNGHLVDNLSIRDLRGIGTDGASFWRLYDTVKNYKKKCRELFPDQTSKAVIAVVEDDSLAEVLKLMVSNLVHRVFVIASKDNPVPKNVITLTTVLRFLITKLSK